MLASLAKSRAGRSVERPRTENQIDREVRNQLPNISISTEREPLSDDSDPTRPRLIAPSISRRIQRPRVECARPRIRKLARSTRSELCQYQGSRSIETPEAPCKERSDRASRTPNPPTNDGQS